MLAALRERNRLAMATVVMPLAKMPRTAPMELGRTQLVKLLEELLLGEGSSKVTSHVALMYIFLHRA